MIVKESIAFERNVNPKKSLKIGKLESIYSEMKEDHWSSENNINDALGWASSNGRTEDVKFLLSLGADPSYQEYDALMEAIREDHDEIVDLFVKSGLNLKNIKDYFLENNDSVPYGEILRYIHRHNIKEGLNFEKGLSKDTLKIGSKHTLEQIFREKDEAGKNEEWNFRRTYDDINDALAWASHYGKTEYIKFLLDQGADPTAYGDAGLHAALFAEINDDLDQYSSCPILDIYNEKGYLTIWYEQAKKRNQLGITERLEAYFDFKKL